MRLQLFSGSVQKDGDAVLPHPVPLRDLGHGAGIPVPLQENDLGFSGQGTNKPPQSVPQSDALADIRPAVAVGDALGQLLQNKGDLPAPLLGVVFLIAVKGKVTADHTDVGLERIGTVGGDGVPGLEVSVVDDLFGVLVVFEDAVRYGMAVPTVLFVGLVDSRLRAREIQIHDLLIFHDGCSFRGFCWSFTLNNGETVSRITHYRKFFQIIQISAVRNRIVQKNGENNPRRFHGMMKDLPLQHVGEHELHRILDTVHMGSLHPVAGVDPHTEGGGADIVASLDSLASVRAVAVEEIHRVAASGPLGGGDETVGETVIVGHGGVLSADGDGLLRAVGVGPQDGDIHRHILRDLGGHVDPAQPDLLVEGEGENGIVFRLQAILGHILQGGEGAGHGGLIVDEAAFDVAVVGHRKAGHDGHVVPVADPQRADSLGGLDGLIQQDEHRILIALHGPGIVKGVRRVVGADQHPREGLAHTGVDSDVLPLHIGEVDAAHRPKPQSAVGVDPPHHEAQSIGVSADTDGLGGVVALHRDVGGVAVVVGDGVAQLGGKGLDDGLDGVVVAHGAGGVDEAAHGG